MTETSSDKVKSKQLKVKVEPDISLGNALSTLKRTRQDAEQQPVAKRRFAERPGAQTTQEEEFEQMSQSLSQVDIDGPCSPIPTTLLPAFDAPSTPELTLDSQKTSADETLRVSLERDSSKSSSLPAMNESPEPSSAPEPKDRKITDFFSAGRFDPNKFFTPVEPPVPIPAPVEDNVKVKIETAASASLSNCKEKKLAGKASKTRTILKKKAPVSAKDKPTTSKRLIKPDPEEMMMSEDESPAKEARNQCRQKATAQEKQRFVRSSPPAAPETDMSLSQIKELLEKIKDGLEPDLFDPRYYCKPCSKPFDRQKTLFNHMNTKHGINIEERRFIVLNYGPKPTMTDASLFCIHCQKQYESKDRFQHHNELHHGAEKIKLSRVAHKLKKGGKSTEIDLEDEEEDEEDEEEMEEQKIEDTTEKGIKNHRRASRKYLENHKSLGYCQKAILKHNGPPPDINDPDFHCSVCNIIYSDRGKYHVHLRITHKMSFPFAASSKKARKAYKGPLPDIHHPQNYCCVCDIYYCQKLVYVYHLRNVHNIDIPFEKSPGIRIAVDDIKDESRKPDMGDPDFFCVFCNRGYTQRSSYLIHLNRMHFIDVPQRRPGAVKPRPPLEPGVSPDVLDPNHYCCVCDVKFAHANSYRIHIKKYHGLGDALEAITLKKQSKRSHYYHDRSITNAGYHEERAKSGQKTLDFKPPEA